MNELFSQAKSYVEQCDLEQHSWVKFIYKANQAEFTQSQEGFFYAVKAFPQMLCKLATQIEDSEQRMLVIENLWEEHGQGSQNHFHTNSYVQYLQSLGIEKDVSQFKQQPWVQEWIKLVMGKDLSAAHYGAYLAGIEFIYARISQIICARLNDFELTCEQSHYAKHSFLDYAHANELLQVAVLCAKKETACELLITFKTAIDEFLKLYENMTFLTQCEAQEIAQEKIAFYYSREDSNIEYKALDQLKRLNSRVLMVCSGGENSIELLKMSKPVHITALDINEHQIKLAQEKIHHIKTISRLPQSVVKFNEGKFEKIFLHLKQRLSYDELQLIAFGDEKALSKLKYLCDQSFSTCILETVFTQEATRYSSQSFSNHFYEVFAHQIKYLMLEKPEFSNIGAVLGMSSPVNYKGQLNAQSQIDFYCGTFNDYFSQCNEKFDMIDISNISDWMSQENLKQIVNNALNHLNCNGLLIARKLLGDYNWMDILNESGLKITEVEDQTKFYTQTIIAQKLS